MTDEAGIEGDVHTTHEDCDADEVAGTVVVSFTGVVATVVVFDDIEEETELEELLTLTGFVLVVCAGEVETELEDDQGPQLSAEDVLTMVTGFELVVLTFADCVLDHIPQVSEVDETTTGFVEDVVGFTG